MEGLQSDMDFENQDADSEAADIKGEIIEEIQYNQEEPKKAKRPYVKGRNTVCDICGKDLKRYPDLKIHIKCMHGGVKDIQCDECGRYFNTSSNMKKHKDNIHLQLKKFVCTFCGKALSSKQSLITHTRSHTGEKPWVCEHCSKSFVDQSALIAHRKSHEEGFSGYQCDYCPKSYNVKKTLNEHIRFTHEGAFNASAERKRIMRQMGREALGLPPAEPKIPKSPKPTSFQCEECGNEYAQKSTLIDHKKTVHGGINISKEICCPECGKVFPKQSKLNRHLGTVHSKMDTNLNYMIMETAEQGFMCRNCGSQCKHMKGIKEHVRFCHLRKERKPRIPKIKSLSKTPSQPKIPSQPKSLKCPQCDRIYNHKKSLKDHIISVHTLGIRQEKLPLSLPSQLLLKLQSKVLGMFGGNHSIVILDFLKDVVNNEEEMEKIANCGDLKKYFEEILNQHKQKESRKPNDLIIQSSPKKMDHETSGEEEDEFDWNDLETKEEPGYSSDVSSSELFPDVKLEARSPSISSNGRKSEQEMCDGEPMEGKEEKEDQALKLESNKGESDELEFIKEREPKEEVDSECSEEDSEEFEPVKMKKVRKSTKQSRKPKEIPVCEECGKIFKKPSKLRHHMMTHMDIKPNLELIDQLGSECFKCLECEMEFRAKKNIIDHIKVVHMEIFGKRDTPYKPKRIELPADLPPIKKIVYKPDPQICNECGKSFTGQPSLKRHIEAQHLGIRYTCTFCGKQYNKETSLNSHVKVVHEGHPKESFVCNECGRTFATRTGLKYHFYVHNPDAKDDRPQSWSKPQPRVQCQECGKDFAGQKGLKIHTDTVHLGLKPFNCDVCGEAFGRKSNLNQHKVNNHSGGMKSWVRYPPKKPQQKREPF